MAQALAESIFDALYLTFAVVIGIYLIVKGGKGSLYENTWQGQGQPAHRGCQSFRPLCAGFI